MVPHHCITALHLLGVLLRIVDVGELAGVLGQCGSLAHLDLGRSWIGNEGAGRLAGVLGQCRSLAHLDLSYNSIGAEGISAHLDLRGNGFGSKVEGFEPLARR